MSWSPERPSFGEQKRNVQTGEKPPLGHKQPGKRCTNMNKSIVTIVNYENPLDLALKAVKLLRGLGHRPY